MEWTKVINDLERVGLTQTDIAAECACSQAYISQLKSGARTGVGFELGSALSALHAKRCGTERRRAGAN